MIPGDSVCRREITRLSLTRGYCIDVVAEYLGQSTFLTTHLQPSSENPGNFQNEARELRMVWIAVFVRRLRPAER
jgi:hypothetical protein